MNTAVFFSSVGPRVNRAAVHQIAHILRPHAAVAKQVVDARINRHDAVEHAGLRIAIETNQNLRGGSWQKRLSRLVRMASVTIGQRTRGKLHARSHRKTRHKIPIRAASQRDAWSVAMSSSG